MTEAEWMECGDPEPMLEFLLAESKPSKRKLRLFAAACCRRIWHLLPDKRSRMAVEVAERYADKEAREQERKDAFAGAEAAGKPFSSGLGKQFRPLMAAVAAEFTASRRRDLADNASSFAASAFSSGVWAKTDAERKAHTLLLRDIMGNPFRPVLFKSSWRTPAIESLAQAAYANRTLPAGILEPDRLAVLADALEDAGCTNMAILEPLRGAGPRVRGFWPLDLVLGKQ